MVQGDISFSLLENALSREKIVDVLSFFPFSFFSFFRHVVVNLFPEAIQVVRAASACPPLSSLAALAGRFFLSSFFSSSPFLARPSFPPEEGIECEEDDDVASFFFIADSDGTTLRRLFFLFLSSGQQFLEGFFFSRATRRQER